MNYASSPLTPHSSRTLMIMAGGTGGHVMPALAVADFLRGEGWKVVWLGTRNGMEAMSATPHSGRLLRVGIQAEASELCISVSDNGCGIPHEVRDKLFTAFFTTKPEGMGIGLSICRSIIEFHRGRLWAEDNPLSPTGSGTIFRFTLPLENA